MLNIQQLKELSSKTGGQYSVVNTNDAFNFCKKVTKSHYENFPVASLLLPKNIRKDIYAVYCFARIADDIADEALEIETAHRAEILQQYRRNFAESDSYSTNPIFKVLNCVIDQKKLNKKPFLKLLEAFQRDIFFAQADTFDDLLDYCTYSANPVGEIILKLFGEYDEQKATYSDSICSALQLTNFWQDLSIDQANGRNYIPKEIFLRYDSPPKFNFKTEEVYIPVLNDVFKFTESLYKVGRNLIPLINSRKLKMEMKLTILGGERIMKKCRNMSINLFYDRPKLSKLDFFVIFVKTLLIKF